jgi:tryptophan synthase alpha chain
MSRIARLFKSKTQNILSVYCTAGFPQLDNTVIVMKALEESGANMIELGMPYSDPLADGPVIQHSSTIALQNGMTIKKMFGQLKDLRNADSPLGDRGISVPVLLMGYMNPILQYGFERFCSDASAVGIDGLILPDLPEYEYETEYGAIIKKYGLDFVFLVTPETSEERVRKLDELSNGFLYAVSSSSTTGKDKNMHDVKMYLQKLKSLKLKNPILVGFGIKDKQTFRAACENANGAIIGTAFIKALENTSDINKTTKEFLASIR